MNRVRQIIRDQRFQEVINWIPAARTTTAGFK
jgi:hypothetical protein